MTTLSQIAQWVAGTLIGDDGIVTSVDTDSRRLRPGSLFVALRGPRFDGHDYSAQAIAAQAAGMLVERTITSTISQILVPDCQEALEKLATVWRCNMSCKVIGVTGSNGKTTTKEMLAHILNQVGPTAATKGNLNNAIGVPLTILAANRGECGVWGVPTSMGVGPHRGEEQFLVVEMGANHPGEIAKLTTIVKPDIVVITNAGRAHLEGFGSLEGVAKAKGEIISGLGPQGICVLNADDPWLPTWQNLAAGRRVITFGTNTQADVILEQASLNVIVEPVWQTAATGSTVGFSNQIQIRTADGPLTIELKLAGQHNVQNALAAIAVALALHVTHKDVCNGLATLRPIPGRLFPTPKRAGGWMIDDTYNANPDSIGAGIKVLCNISGHYRLWLILGDLGELGTDAATLHQDIGSNAKQVGIDHLWGIGTLSAGAVAAFGTGGRHFTDKKALIEALQSVLGADDLLLLKGSHSAGMDEVVQALAAPALVEYNGKL